MQQQQLRFSLGMCAVVLTTALGSPAVSQEPSAHGVEVPSTMTFSGSNLAVTASDLVLSVVVDSEATEGRIEIKDPGVKIVAHEFSFDPKLGVLARQVIPPAADADADKGAEPAPGSQVQDPLLPVAVPPFVVEVDVVLPAGGVLTINSLYSEIEVLTQGEVNAAKTTLRGSVGSGQISVAGALAVDLEVRDAEIQVAGSPSAPAGPLKLQLRGSTGRFDGFSGSSNLVAFDSNVVVSGAAGTLILRQEGGSLMITGSTAGISGSANNGSMELEDVKGAAIQLTLANAELAVTRSDFTSLNLAARRSRANLVQTKGSATLEWASGNLQVQGHVGKMTLGLKSAGVAELSGLLDAINLTVDESEASLNNVGDVKLTIRNGSARVDGCKALAVDAREAELTLNGFETQRAWIIDSSQVEADFARAGRRTRLKLDGGSTGSIRLPGPCFVRFSGRSNIIDSEYRISGCELLTADPTQRKRLRFGGLNGVDGSNGTILQLDLSAESSATVGESSN